MEKVNYSKEVFNGVRTSLEMITPMMAAEYLAMNKTNRLPHLPTVKNYANAMRRGEWRLNGDTICFDRLGNLVNGQHRLKAVIDFGGAVPFLVVRGVQDKSFLVYDNGRNRSNADVLYLEGVPNHKKISAIINRYFVLSRKIANIGFSGEQVKPTKDEYVNFYNSNLDLIQNAYDVAELVYRKYRLLKHSEIGGILLYLVLKLHHDFEFVKNFFVLFANPCDCEYDSINALRDKLIKELTQTAKIPFPIKMKYIMKSWNGYVLKKKMTLLKLTSSELESIWFI